ncbi:MAG: FAD:protein FMN transferase [Alphaproteobacteria bacterium]|nr:FAD:protein FMN transferase [Alphaproteobacteria bacterium]
MKTNTLQSACLLIVILAIVVSCERKQEPVTFTGFTQGTTFVVRYFGNPDSSAVAAGIDSVFRLINETASLYDSASIISKINRNEPVGLNPVFERLFKRSAEISAETEGTFDITVGPLVKAYGFYRKKQLPVDGSKIDSLRRLVGYTKVALKDGRVVKKDPGVMIDFNAIAQGYTVDLVAEFLEGMGLHDYLVEIGGEVRASGAKPGGDPWVVGIEQPAPNDSAAQVVQQKLRLDNRSAATSGNARKFFVRNGIKYSHTIDPQTGSPVHHSLLSVTVLASDCMTADAYATACMVMGLEKALKFINGHPGTDAYFIYSDPSGHLKVQSTPGFSKLCIEKP